MRHLAKDGRSAIFAKYLWIIGKVHHATCGKLSKFAKCMRYDTRGAR